MRRSDLVQSPTKGSTPRTTQIVFGERQHLLRVLDSLETTAVPQVRLNQERRVIEELDPRAHQGSSTTSILPGMRKSAWS